MKALTITESKVLSKLNMTAYRHAVIEYLKPTIPQMKAIRSLVERKYIQILSEEKLNGKIFTVTIKDIRNAKY